MLENMSYATDKAKKAIRLAAMEIIFIANMA